MALRSWPSPCTRQQGHVVNAEHRMNETVASSPIGGKTNPVLWGPRGNFEHGSDAQERDELLNNNKTNSAAYT